MKISCQSCGAKYTIADEKVRGRTVKIRCKKCSAAIVISGQELDMPMPSNEEDGETRIYEAPPGASPFAAMGGAEPPVEWTVNVAEGDQRTVVIDEIIQLFRSGVINDDTYVWKDGMEDWRPVSEVPELVEKVRAPAAAKTPSIPPRAAAAPSGSGGPALQGAAKGAARVESRAKDKDLFGAGAPAPEEKKPTPSVAPRAAASASPTSQAGGPMFGPMGGSHMTAERGENSVLFTLDAIRAPKPKAADVADMMGHAEKAPTSGIVDIKSLTAVATVAFDNVPDDIMNIGGGSIMGNAALAAPVLPTTIEPEPPPPKEEYMGMGPAPQSGSNKTMIVVLAAALGLVIIAFGGYLVFGKSSKTPDANNPSAATADTAKAAPSATTADTSTAAAGDAGATAAPAESGKAETKPGTDKVPGKLEPIKPGGPLPVDTSKTAAVDTSKKPDDKAVPAKTEEPKAAEPPAGADKPFDRGAAVSALNAAAGAASGCKKPDGPTGTGRVSVTFAPTGRVTSSNVEGPPFAGTSVGGCVAARFRGASVPPFTGSPVTVHKSFTIN
jgi:predicted Zn finger-like uncharacterized protein